MRRLGLLSLCLALLAFPAPAEDSVRLDVTLLELQALDYAVRTSDIAARIAVPLLIKIGAQAKVAPAN